MRARPGPRWLLTLALMALAMLSGVPSARAADDGVPGVSSRYANRPMLPDPGAADCPDVPRGLEQVRGNLYRHTSGAGLAVHSGLVLITPEGGLVIDPALTCTARWLLSEIRRRFDVPVRYVLYTHAHADHISGGQVFQRDGAVVVANERAVEPIVGEKIPTAPRRCRTACSMSG